MKNRYIQLFKSESLNRQKQAPVIILAGALLQDIQTDTLLAQIKYKSNSNLPIIGMKVALQPMNSDGEPVGNPVIHDYCNLDVNQGEEFGQKEPILIKNKQTKQFKVDIKTIVFSDSSLWSADGEEKILYDHNITSASDSERNEVPKVVQLKNHILSDKKNMAIVIGISVAIVLIFIMTMVGKMSDEEKRAVSCITSYQSMLKDPDSLTIRGDIYLIKDEELDNYLFFTAGGTNSYGTMIYSVPIFKSYHYIGDYEDKYDDKELSDMSEDERDDYYSLTKARLLYAKKNLYEAVGSMKGKTYKDKEGNTFTKIDGKKIARKIKCSYKE